MAPDHGPFAGLTYRAWGLLLFFAASAVALLPMLLQALRLLRRTDATAGPTAPDMALTLLACGMIPVLFAFFNTQMHERYWHAALRLWAAYGFLRRDYVLYVLVSVAYFFNLEGVLRRLELKKYTVLVFDPRFVAGLFAVALVLGLVKLYRLKSWQGHWPLVFRPAPPESGRVG